MPASRIAGAGCGLLSMLILGAGFASPNDDPPTAALKKSSKSTAKPSPKAVTSKRPGPKNLARKEDEPPPCGSQSKQQGRQPVRSMPELYKRMSERMMSNPATAWQGMVEEMSNMEGPALEGISLSIAEERLIGLKARTQYLKQAEAFGARVVDDDARSRYLRELVRVLSARMKNRRRYPQIEVTLIDGPIPDGQSFAGGYLAFTTGLLNEPDEATVAGVVAHELAHLDRGHLYEYARRTKLLEATYAAQRPGTAPNMDQMFTRQMALYGLMMNPYRPEHESEADCTSVTWLYQEGYDPRALVGFFERMHGRNRDGPANPFFSFGRAHPFSLDRAEAVKDRLRQLQNWKRRDDLGLFAENLRRRQVKGRAAPERAADERAVAGDARKGR
jgi:beta-barrel assembly-enhancing protease